MKIREIQLNEGVLKVETKANDKQWNILMNWVDEFTDNTRLSVIKELKHFDSIIIKILE